MPMTPMMRKWQEIKAEHADSIVFFRLGDFYEMFFDDAKTASHILGITLTARDCGLAERAPMCGVPYHAANVYVKKLIERGYRVAICEQLSAPNGKEMVKREVVRVITAGTFDDAGYLDAEKNNFVASIYTSGNNASVSWCDITTGEFYSMNAKTTDIENIKSMINPREIVESNGHYAYAFNASAAYGNILRYFNITNTKIFDIEKDDAIINSAGALLHYLQTTQKAILKNITKISIVRNGEFMILDKTARDNLEIMNQFRNPTTKQGSLLWVLDDTQTPMGARRLARELTRPLQDINKINERFDLVQKYIDDGIALKDLRNRLHGIADISRLCGKAANGSILPRDLINLAKSIENMGQIGVKNDVFVPLFTAIHACFRDNPPIKTDEGGFVRDGFDGKLDELRNAEKFGREWLLKLETTERAETKIKELKIAYNRIVGYYFEIPTKLANAVPYRFTRKGSTANADRYTTSELKEIEDKILNATTASIELEQKILTQIREMVLQYINALNVASDEIAYLDMISAFAYVAMKNNYTRPNLNQEHKFEFKSARHPVVEKLVGEQNFIPNDGEMQNTTMLITGPNMAGKSTFMRMAAHIVIMAHIGSFVPCEYANIPITDRIFTRIGASDNLVGGESTFMVEMNEVSNIVHNATKRSLILLDEVGRGTGTKDGLALASSIITYITDKIGANTMFATHFHELTNIKNPRIENYKVLTESIGGDIVFLHKVEKGIETESFGIDVAKLAGLPKEIVDRARRLYVSY